MKNRWYGSVLIVVLILGALAAGFTGYQRLAVESKHRSVELVMPYDEIASLARRSGQQPAEVLRQFREQGLTTVLFKEPTIAEVEASGEFTVMNGQQLLSLGRLGGAEPQWVQDLARRGEINSTDTFLLTGNQESARRVEGQLKAKTGSARTYHASPNLYVVRTSADANTLRGTGLGFDTARLEEVSRTGLFTMVQVRNWPGVNPDGLDAVFEPIKKIPNLSAVLFQDDTLPGFPDELKTLAYEIQTLGVPVGQVEFFNQKGLSKVGLLLDKQVVRVHSIPPEQMAKLTPQEAFDRYMLAATDRNMRALLIYPRTENGDVLQNNLDYVAQIKSGLLAEGLYVDRASIFTPFPVRLPVIFVAGLGVIAGGLLLLHRLGLCRGGWLLGLASVLVWGALLAFATDPARKLMALAAVVVFPTLSILLHLRERGASVGGSIVLLVRTSLFSLLGALFTVGLLSDAGFMLKLDQFMGVKLAHLLPLLIVVGAVYCMIPAGESCLRRVKELLNQPIYVGVAALTGVLLVIAAIYLMRTGNEGTMVSSALELKFRTLLENVLVVRPRTKEFLLGHPLMLLLFYTGYRNHRYVPLLFLGAIGQVSLVNTFAHLHTPLLISLLRFANGLWLGILVGLGLIVAYNLFNRWGRRFLYE